MAAAIANQNPIIPQRLSKHPSIPPSADRKATVEARGNPPLASEGDAPCLIGKSPGGGWSSSEAKLCARARSLPPSLTHIRVRADTSVSSFESLNPPPPSQAQSVAADPVQNSLEPTSEIVVTLFLSHHIT